MYEKFGQFIDGKWQQSSSGETYDVINPATEEKQNDEARWTEGEELTFVRVRFPGNARSFPFIVGKKV